MSSIMSSNRTKRRRIREELIDSVLYELEPNHINENCAEKNTAFIQYENTTVPIHFKLDNVLEASIVNDNDNCYDNQLLTVFTDLCSEVKLMGNMPKNARTILKTRTIQHAQNLKVVNPGFYHHFGLSAAIKQYFHNYTEIADIDIIKVVIGIDGLPLFKSSCSQFWPILGYIRPLKNVVLYGRHLMSFNVHGLIHISDDYKQFGPLDNIAAFPFENYLKQLKRMALTSNEQTSIEVKISDKNLINCEELKHKHTDGPLLENIEGSQYKKSVDKKILDYQKVLKILYKVPYELF
ncbi:Uncharacterized protein FWK35_00030189 [Aphis craccivora]|uniref:Uncharacterized protein n=1 Tax=Aphis craccivora TaxID=307492 RepID=A0A6G0WSH6_APHCR|nr:Uncharacterized protein FWK35_00030189 [Aphis craccivora]